LKSKKVLVTGSNGQVAQDIFFLSSFTPELTFHFLDRKRLDITSRDNVKEIIKKISPDYIINTAAYTKVDLAEKESEEAYAVNAYALQNLAQEGLESKVIHISTDYVYHSSSGAPLKENAEVNPKGIYAKSKLQGEIILSNAHPNYIIFRTSWVYGPHGRNFLKTILRLSREKSTLMIVDDQIGSPTYTLDLAEMIIQFILNTEKNLIASSAWNNIYNYSNEGAISWYEFAKMIISQSQLKTVIEPIPTYKYPTPAKRPFYSVLNLDKIKNIPGVKVYDWKDRISDCLERIIN
jgi:dTDP-4-dehydrorhamnose reductase